MLAITNSLGMVISFVMKKEDGYIEGELFLRFSVIIFHRLFISW
jgi:hypothetical protein